MIFAHLFSRDRRPMGSDRRHPRFVVPQGRDVDGGNRTRCARVYGVPADASAEIRTNPVERLNEEIKRRADVVEIFPNPVVGRRNREAQLALARDGGLGATGKYRMQDDLDPAPRFEQGINSESAVEQVPRLLDRSKQPRHVAEQPRDRRAG